MNVGDWLVSSSRGKFKGWFILGVSHGDALARHLRIDASYRLTAIRYTYLKAYHRKIVELNGLNCRTEFKLLLSGLIL